MGKRGVRKRGVRERVGKRGGREGVGERTVGINRQQKQEPCPGSYNGTSDI